MLLRVFTDLGRLLLCTIKLRRNKKVVGQIPKASSKQQQKGKRKGLTFFRNEKLV